jgi:GNAT superfamily N-acetyltransferase
MVEGFADRGEIVDLERHLDEYQSPVESPPNAQFKCLESKDHDLLVDFLDREFPGRWKYDTLYKIRFEGPSCVFVLMVDGSVEGFALIQSAEHRSPIGGGVWRSSLGASWGALGPIGISERLRGKGYGSALLGAALTELKHRGVQNAIIDWTNLVEFYGKHGFTPTRIYRAMSLKL